jgi:hypothetical protein
MQCSVRSMRRCPKLPGDAGWSSKWCGSPGGAVCCESAAYSLRRDDPGERIASLARLARTPAFAQSGSLVSVQQGGRLSRLSVVVPSATDRRYTPPWPSFTTLTRAILSSRLVKLDSAVLDLEDRLIDRHGGPLRALVDRSLPPAQEDEVAGWSFPASCGRVLAQSQMSEPEASR